MAKKLIDLDIDCKSAIISHGRDQITVTVENADQRALIDSIGLDAFLDHYPESDILESIGKSSVMAHFRLEE